MERRINTPPLNATPLTRRNHHTSSTMANRSSLVILFFTAIIICFTSTSVNAGGHHGHGGGGHGHGHGWGGGGNHYVHHHGWGQDQNLDLYSLLGGLSFASLLGATIIYLARRNTSGRRRRSASGGEWLEDDEDVELHKNGLRFQDMLTYVKNYFSSHGDVKEFKLY